MKVKSLRFDCRQVLVNARVRHAAMLASAGLVFAAAPGVNTAQAQEAPATERADTALTEVLVTARRREESAQEVPIAITALGGDELENRHITSLENVQVAVPEFSISQSSGRPNSPVYGLRGIRPTESVYGQDPTVAVYFADVVVSPAEGTNLGLYDLASLQVLKGPQGTLFGRNTTGGALLMTPKRPGKDFGADFMLGYGNFGRNETQLGLDMPVADNFAVRLSGRTINSDGYQKNVADGVMYRSKLGGESTRSVRLSLVWNIIDSIENYTIFNYDNKDTNGRGTVLQAINRNGPPAGASVRCYDGPLHPNNNGVPCSAGDNLPDYYAALARAQSRDIRDVESEMQQFDRIKTWGVVNTTTATLADALTLKGIGGYRYYESTSAYDIDASQIPGILTAEGGQDLDSASYEVQLLGSAFDDKFNWVTGVYWYYEDGTQTSAGRVLQGLSSNNPYIQEGAVHNNSYAAFVQGTYTFAQKWSLTAGARYTVDEKEMTITTRYPTACQMVDPITGVALPLANCAVTLSDTFSEPTGTLSLDYKLTDSILLYAASRYGYRSGGFNLRATSGAEYAPFNPETVTDLELGTKADWSIANWQMRSNVAVFHQWYNDIQRTVGISKANGTPGSAVTNAAKAKVFGVELQQTIAPTSNLSLQLNYAYTNPKYDEWTEKNLDLSTPTTTVLTDLTQTPFHFTPKHVATGSATYTVPLAKAGEELQFSVIASYRSGVWINPLQTSAAIKRTPQSVIPFLRQEEYTTVDLNAAWNGINGSALDLAVYVKNATDKDYAVGGIQLYESSYNSVSRFGMVTRAYAEPRTFGAQLRYKF